VPSVVDTGEPQLGQNRAPSGSGWSQTSHGIGTSIGVGADPGTAVVGTVGDSDAMEPTTFARPEDFRAWLRQHHASQRELWVGYHRKATGKPSMTWEESVDEALCYGWIDGRRKRVDDERYMIRFTPRRPESIWSAVNIRRVAELEDQGRMRAAGRKAFAARREDRSGIYSYERRDEAVFDATTERRFRAKRRAWAAFEAMPRSYRQAVIRWVMTAKREETRERRLAKLIELSAAGERVPPFTTPGKTTR
jgi:uncharacterized protein YdeI (YjbR/CyaY-like superfamily)